MAILDSKHTCDHVLEELRLYSTLVPDAGYLIVEDTNLNGRLAWPDYGPGPGEAVDAFLAERSDFVVDRSPEKKALPDVLSAGILRPTLGEFWTADER